MLIEYTQTDPFTGEEITTVTDAEFIIEDIIHFDDAYGNEVLASCKSVSVKFMNEEEACDETTN